MCGCEDDSDGKRFFVSLLLGGSLDALLVLLKLAGGDLLREDLLLGALDLLLVDVLDQDTLVLEDVSLGLQVGLVVEVTVDLLGFTVLLEETAEDALTAEPEELGGSTGVTGSSALTGTRVTSLLLGLKAAVGAGTRVNLDGLLQDEAITDELADLLACTEQEKTPPSKQQKQKRKKKRAKRRSAQRFFSSLWKEKKRGRVVKEKSKDDEDGEIKKKVESGRRAFSFFFFRLPKKKKRREDPGV